MPQDYILARLLSNNAQWAEDVDRAEPGFFAQTAKGQSPKVLYIGCADSRVPESVVTASKPGDIFVHRNIANQFHLNDDSALSVLTYAVAHVGVQHVILVGHTNCGGAAACHAAAHSGAPPSDEPPADPLTRWLAPLTEIAREHEDLTELVEANVRAQVANIAQAGPMAAAWAAGKDVQVHGWVYELETGRMRDLGVSVGKAGPV
ncbi:carbonic anhydrase [Trametes versicolor FP-101664 SS1]|uniref:carbonic anhydrase n=1 Tax=Trametes versicolor (strain FP-101664) TaxID=717944 RepID=UPI0004621ABF|nr:carbonic anhydrase [Trametes versicolor FP-101664 SS1]EIW56303.1 carbonic anhydrase [Trametes versicolor FP-101664 SS1]